MAEYHNFRYDMQNSAPINDNVVLQIAPPEDLGMEN